MADAPLNPRSSVRGGGGGNGGGGGGGGGGVGHNVGGVGPIDLDVDESVASTDSDETFEEPRFLCTPRGRIVTLFCLLVLAAVAIALGVTQPWKRTGGDGGTLQSADNMTGMGDRGQGVGNFSFTPTPMPTYWFEASTTPAAAPNAFTSPTQQGATAPPPTDFFAPTPAPTRGQLDEADFQRYRDLAAAVVDAGASPPGSFQASAAVASATPASTPRQEALNWLAFDDPLALAVESDPPDRIAQRYGCAVLFFGTVGGGWNDNTGWMTESHECDWFGVSCVVREVVGHSDEQVQVTQQERMVSELALQENNLYGVLPPEVGTFRFMETLGLFSNTLGGSLPSEVGNLTMLERMWIDDNYFNSDLPTEIGRLAMLRQVDLHKNNFAGQIPTEIGGLADLTRFSAYDNKLNGTIPTEVGLMAKMKELFLDTNSIGGAIPPQIGGASQLEDLRLFDNNLGGQIPVQMGQLSNLRVFYADTNSLFGQIPPQAISGMTSLVDFQAFNNLLNGFLPPEFGALPNLKVIALNGNSIGGSIPDALCRPGSKLLRIDLSENALFGDIPQNIDQCAELLKLQLSRNTIGNTNSQIPTQIGNMSQLKSLYLDYNQLQGQIPAEIGDISTLEELKLEGNMLVGTVPCTGNLVMAQADCEGFNAPVRCDCCTLCCGPSGCLAPQVVPQLPKALVP